MPKKKQKYQNLIYVQLDEYGDESIFYPFYDPTEKRARLLDRLLKSAGLKPKTQFLYDGLYKDVGIYQFVKTAKVRTKIEVI